jgi:protein O-GlcNAc transferase
MGDALQQAGALQQAVAYYNEALRRRPNYPAAWANLAAANMLQGMVRQAVDAFTTALSLNPGLGQGSVRCSLGDVWRAQGAAGRGAAAQCYAAAARSDPGCAAAWRGMGDCAREKGDAQRALECYREAVRLEPTAAAAHTALGQLLRDLGRGGEAEAAFEAAAALQPSCALAAGNLAGARYEGGKLEEAVALYRRALELDPGLAECHNNMGNALRECGRLAEATSAYITCIQLQLRALAAARVRPLALPLAADPAARAAAARLAASYSNLGGALKLQGRAAESVVAYEHAAVLQPAVPDAHAMLGSAHKDAGRHDDALAAYTRALAMRPDYSEAFAALVHSRQCVCDWAGRREAFARLEREARRDLATPGRLPSVQPFHAMHYPFPRDLVLDITRRYAEYCLAAARRLPGAPAALPHPPAAPLRPGERLRVAYVSSDFGNHPLSHLMGSVFGLHDRARVEVHCYALSQDDGSEWRARIMAEAEHFLDVSAWGPADIARRISADGVHVAVNLNGYTKGARNEVFALRPAPVQASFLGFPATAGADFLPWILLDKTVCPPASRPCYSEPGVAYMPHSYFVNDYRRAHADVLQGGTAPTRASLGLPTDAVVYSCANQLYKLDPDTFDAWCAILRRVPASVLWLLRFPPEGERRVRAEAAARGVDPARLVFSDVAPKARHVARMGLADLFLDTPACNAHTTGARRAAPRRATPPRGHARRRRH